MALLCVLCGLNEPYHDYEPMLIAMRGVSDQSIQCTEELWFLRTKKSAVEVYDSLLPFLREGDRLLVFPAGAGYCAKGFEPPIRKWMINNWKRRSKAEGTNEN